MQLACFTSVALLIYFYIFVQVLITKTVFPFPTLSCSYVSLFIKPSITDTSVIEHWHATIACTPLDKIHCEVVNRYQIRFIRACIFEIQMLSCCWLTLLPVMYHASVEGALCPLEVERRAPQPAYQANSVHIEQGALLRTGIIRCKWAQWLIQMWEGKTAFYASCHCNDVTRASYRPKSTNQLFLQQCVQAGNKEHTKTLHYRYF